MTASDKPLGVLGRGPWFWAAMMVISTAIIAVLGVTDAINNNTFLLLMLLVPIGLMFALFISLSRKAEQGRAACGMKGAAQAAYIKRVGVFSVVYMISIFAMVFVTKNGDPGQVVRVILALLPGFAIIGVFWAVGRLIVEEQDEFLRMLIVRQSLIATAFAMSLATVWGFLENADLVIHLDAYWVAVAWFAGLAVGGLANRIQYGTWGAT